MKHFYFNF